MQTPKLPNVAIRHLRGLGHALDPVIAIGKTGISEGLVAETKRALLVHELIKVRVHSEAPTDRKEAAAELAAATSSTLTQVLGRTFLLYRRNPAKAKIALPKRVVKGWWNDGSQTPKTEVAAGAAAAEAPAVQDGGDASVSDDEASVALDQLDETVDGIDEN